MGTRLSQSAIWRMQRRYYEQKGVRAWQRGELPYYVTSNPLIAHAYAAVIAGFLRDRSRIKPGTSQPVHIVELGAGSGQLAYHILRRLDRLMEPLAVQSPGYRYVMSDISMNYVEEWSVNPKLLPFAEKGQLDYCLFDAGSSEALSLQVGGRTIRGGDLEHPVIVIANFVFDSIPQDLFYYENGTVSECRVADRPSPASEDATTNRLPLHISYHPVKGDCYAHAGYNRVLKEYRSLLSGEGTHILFPSAALGCLERIAALTTGQELVLLAADKGTARLEELERQPVPEPVPYAGSVSLPMNFHALYSLYKQKGIEPLGSPYDRSGMHLACLMAVSHPQSYTETRLAHELFYEHFNPDDFYQVKASFWNNVHALDLRQLLAWIRLSGYDSSMAEKAADRLYLLLAQANAADRGEADDVLKRVREASYPVADGSQDIAFTLASLYFAMGRYEEATQLFQESLRTDPDSAATCYNLGLCGYERTEYAEALEYFERTLMLYPAYEGAERYAAECRQLLDGKESVNG
ncbi:SAM-dependent methyltransferase [Paenibacillus sp. MBLB4367]|uniref:SAM-dependent methyltransferase n=1 Tax=Paenibacillus sp. MBLB4367 TaxID=3384767 RepID=UPI0039083F20